MKFGKRLLAEASRRWSEHYFDYKAVKKAIQDDITDKDSCGSHVRVVLVRELNRVSAFYNERAEQLEAALMKLTTAGLNATDSALQQLRGEVQELIKFTALNYLAVVKAIKKRNRHFKENLGLPEKDSLHALDLLAHQEFFKSTRLASLATQAEVLHKRKSTCCSGDTKSPTDQMLVEYQCPICLDTLHDPVVLTCAHRFCWGCLVAHCTTSRGMHAVPGKLGLEDDRVSLPATPYVILEQMAIAEELQEASHLAPYNCPLCRKPQLADVDHLQVDSNLSDFIETLKAVHLAVPVASPQVLPVAATPWGVIPPQSPQHQGKLTVLLDLDGTLVSSFTPRRAPRLPPSIVTHIVGRNSQLNPAGVFVVERPGLDQFLSRLSAWAEVIVFTAGLEDYAKPIIDAIDPLNKYFAMRIYREGTLRTDHYQCVKDMSRLNRDLQRTVLVDDTPLAFLHQPNNGVPVLGFRGDPDDRLLQEAVLPLLQTLECEPDVRAVLQRRFDMCTWFKRNGFPIDTIIKVAEAASISERAAKSAAQPEAIPLSWRDTTPLSASSSVSPPASPLQQSVLATAVQAGRPVYSNGSSDAAAVNGAMTAAPAAQQQQCVGSLPSVGPRKPFLMLTGFDKTLTDFDAGERLIEQLAPELLPMLSGLDPREGRLAMINTVLAELQRRGVTRDDIARALHDIGAAEVPVGTIALLRSAAASGVDTRILSDANTMFVAHILAGARAVGMVQEVITNTATFEHIANATPPSAPAGACGAAGGCGLLDSAPCSAGGTGGSTMLGGTLGGTKARAAASHRLVVSPCHSALLPAHGCLRCPANLCKGAVVAALRMASGHERLIYCGSGVNDVCAALHLGPQDVLLARAGHPLAQYCDQAGRGSTGGLQAVVRTWRDQEDLRRCVSEVIGGLRPVAA